jgi:hypothetical protein
LLKERIYSKKSLSKKTGTGTTTLYRQNFLLATGIHKFALEWRDGNSTGTGTLFKQYFNKELQVKEQLTKLNVSFSAQF